MGLAQVHNEHTVCTHGDLVIHDITGLGGTKLMH